jgi:hypothetical protein
VGGVSAGLGAASGAIGSKILDDAYGGYDVLQATQMVAAGNALLGGAIGAIGGGIAGAKMGAGVEVSAKSENNKRDTSLGLLGVVIEQTLGGLVGYGLFTTTATPANPLNLNLGQVAASAAVGSAVLGGSLAVGIVACAVLVAACCGAAMSDDDVNEAALEEGHGAALPAPRM